MHLLEQYALNCGVKIDRPFIQCNYFPIPFKDYIVIHPSSGMPAKNYDYYDEVIDLLLPYLQERNIKIIQIGGQDDESLKNCYSMQGVTSLSQTFYLIQKALLVVGNDSFSAHVAGFFNKKLVTLYSNIYIDCCRPYWGDKSNQVLIQSPRSGRKPSFSAKEENKVVNNIPPEKIASPVLEFLEIPHSLNKITTVDIGKKYQDKTVEVVPNHRVSHKLPDDYPINLRLDFGFHPKYFMEWSNGKKIHIVLDKPIDPKFFLPLKDNILKVTAFIDKSFPLEYPQIIKRMGIDIELFTKKTKELNDLRVTFIDWLVQHYVAIQKKDLDFVDKICDNTYFKSNKIIHSNGKTYNSRASMLRDEAGSRELKIIDCPEFWEEAEYFNIYNKDA